MCQKIFQWTIFFFIVMLLISCQNEQQQALGKIQSTGSPFTVTEFNNYICSGNISMVELYLKAGINPNATDKDGLTPLDYAANADNPAIFKMLFRHGAKLNPASNRPVFRAVYAGKITNVKILDKHRANLNAKMQNGFTPLVATIISGHTEIADYLLRRGYRINYNDFSDNLSFTLAAGTGDLPQVKRLSGKGAKFVWKDSPPEILPLHCAALHGRTNVVRWLLENGSNPNQESSCNSTTPLSMAARNGNIETAKILLHFKANPNHVDALEFSPLLYAACGDHEDFLIFLLKNGADPNLKDSNGNTPLDLMKRLSLEKAIWIIKRGK